MEQEDKIWYNDPSVLWKKPTEVFPLGFNNTWSKERKINSIIRTSIYGLAGVFVLSRQMFVRALLIIIAIVIITLIYYESEKNPKTEEEVVIIPKDEGLHMYNLRESDRKDYTDTSNNNISDILHDIQGTFKVQEMVEPNKEYKYFNNQLHRDQTLYSLYRKNKTGKTIYGGQKHETHIKALKDVYNDYAPTRLL